MKKNKIILPLGVGMIAAFVIWTVLLTFVDVKTVAVTGTSVGFSSLNFWARDLIGVNMTMYNLTDALSIVPIATVGVLAVIGLVQCLKRHSLLKVDREVLAFGVFCVAVFAAFILFEVLEINYRPVLIEGRVEASYPSSTTLLVMSIMPAAMIPICKHIKSGSVKSALNVACGVFVAFMVIGRVISGVHWITDIIGGALLSLGLNLIYRAVCVSKTE